MNIAAIDYPTITRGWSELTRVSDPVSESGHKAMMDIYLDCIAHMGGARVRDVETGEVLRVAVLPATAPLDWRESHADPKYISTSNSQDLGKILQTARDRQLVGSR
jgi:hypothetical protein